MSYRWGFDVISDRNASVALLKAKFAGRKYEVTGSSKREKRDVYDPRIGTILAISRALRALASEMEAEASALIEKMEADKQARISRVIKRSERRVLSQPGRRMLLSVLDIAEKYGPEAADRAVQRRKIMTPPLSSISRKRQSW